MSLPIEWIDHLFAKLTLTYGRDFAAQYEGLPIADVKTHWAHELARFESRPRAISHALANLPVRPVNVLQFVSLCNTLPAEPEALPALPAPADPARVAAEMAKLSDSRKPRNGGSDGRDWARRILNAPEGRTPTVLAMARGALEGCA